MARDLYPMCARCTTRVCSPKVKVHEEPPLDKAPRFCPMKTMPEVIEKSMGEYDKPDIRHFAQLALIQESECYERSPNGFRTKIPRVEELIQFAQKCGYKKLGIAFCGGLDNETRILSDILQRKGFEVVSVRCKVGAIPVEKVGIQSNQKIFGPDAFETMCSPIAQAEILNNVNLDLAIMLGLCIGHDTLFIKYCKVPLTVLAVKDRVFGHNPLMALYLSGTIYYGRLMNETK